MTHFETLLSFVLGTFCGVHIKSPISARVAAMAAVSQALELGCFGIGMWTERCEMRQPAEGWSNILHFPSERVSLLCLSFVLYTLSQGVRCFSI